MVKITLLNFMKRVAMLLVMILVATAAWGQETFTALSEEGIKVTFTKTTIYLGYRSTEAEPHDEYSSSGGRWVTYYYPYYWERIYPAVIVGGYEYQTAIDPNTEAETITIPGMIDGMIVKGIGDGAFRDCRGIKNIIIKGSTPDEWREAWETKWRGTEYNGVILDDDEWDTSSYGYNYYGVLADGGSLWDSDNHPLLVSAGLGAIGYSAFAGCDSLESVKFPMYSRYIKQLQYDEYNLNSLGNPLISGVNIVDVGGIIGSSAFYNCYNLESVDLSSTVTSLGDYAFSGCRKLKAFPNYLDEIGEEALFDCSSFDGSIYISRKVRTIGKDAFSYCVCQGVDVEAGNPVFDSRNNCHSLIETATNTLIKGGTLSTIPAGVVTIGKRAFAGFPCPDMSFPSTLRRIEEEAFSVYLDGFDNNNLSFLYATLDTLALPSSLKYIGNRAFAGNYITSLSIPKSVTEIGYGAFSDCRYLQDIDFKARVEKIEGIFGGCFRLKKFTIPKGVKSVSDFSDCFLLESVKFPEGLESIKGFNDCISLKSLNIPASVSDISGFMICSSLENIQVNSKNKKYDSRYNCNAIIETETNKLILGCGKTDIPDNVDSIANYAFYGHNGMSPFVIPASVKSIGDGAFYGYRYMPAISGDFLIKKGSKYGDIKSITSLIKEPFAITADATSSWYLGREKVFGYGEWERYYDYGHAYSSNYDYNFYKDVTLYVPYGTKEAYENTPGWNKFENIVELPNGPGGGGSTAINEIVASDNTETENYLIDGRIVSKATRGLNIVRMKDGSVKKVLVK